MFLLGIHAAEWIYNRYSASDRYISNLGVGRGPPAPVFNASVFLFGILGAAAARSLRRGGADRVLWMMLALSSLGAMGVGASSTTGT